MTEIASFSLTTWDQACPPDEQRRAVHTLERGGVLLFPKLDFALRENEKKLLSPATAGQAKNVSLNPANGELRGSGGDPAEQLLLQGLMQRYAHASNSLLHQLLPGYDSGLKQARTSFRPAEVAGRAISWRKDDTRLHVDSFPSSPMRGERILRVFSNVNPNGQSRVWKLGEPFEAMAQRFQHNLKGPPWGSHRLLALLGVTKRERSAYDHFMLRLHDLMKADLDYQASVPQTTHEFAPGSSWIVFTDQASHAALRGQYALEQTYHLPVDSMHDPALSPLRVLERLRGKALV